MRVAMALELGSADLWSRLRSQKSCARPISAFRRAHEHLRQAPAPGVAESMLRMAAEQAGLPAADVAEAVEEWMFRRPLKYLPMLRRRGLTELLDFLARRGVKAGVMSDYPVDAKLAALGLSSSFSLAICTTDPDIDALKPSPRGFCHACDRWNLTPVEVLYVGDRADVDAAGATAAGLPCAIIGRRRSGTGYLSVTHFQELQSALDRHC
jgi:HAD superfamily hydrolase (TIGR01549 family)